MFRRLLAQLPRILTEHEASSRNIRTGFIQSKEWLDWIQLKNWWGQYRDPNCSSLRGTDMILAWARLNKQDKAISYFKGSIDSSW